MAKRVSYTVMSHSPFTVLFTDNASGKTKTVEYKVALATSELESESGFVIFDEEPKVKKSTASRRAVRGSGITGLTVEFQLIHLQNMAILRDNLKKSIGIMEEHLKSGVLLGLPGSLHSDIILVSGLLEESNKVLNFIVQDDFQSPVAKDLWEFDPSEHLNTTKF